MASRASEADGAWEFTHNNASSFNHARDSFHVSSNHSALIIQCHRRPIKMFVT